MLEIKSSASEKDTFATILFAISNALYAIIIWSANGYIINITCKSLSFFWIMLNCLMIVN